APGRLTVEVHAQGFDTRLSLYDNAGNLLTQSNGQAPANRADLIDQHVEGSTYFLKVEGLGNGTGSYDLVNTFTLTSSPFQPIPVGFRSGALVTGDFNGDGWTDLATANSQSSDVTVLLGQGDGTFQNAGSVPVGNGPYGLVAGDF